MSELAELRDRLAEIDRELVRGMAARQRLAEAIGRRKESEARGLRDFAQEKRVIERARRLAREESLSPDLAGQVLELLIEASLVTQEEQRVASRSGGLGRRALVIGGGGRMGGWLVRFLQSQGFQVEIADPAGASSSEAPWFPDWRQSSLEQDLVIVAAPLRATAVILDELAQRRPSGVVFDVGSLKAPLRTGLERLVHAGVRTSSMHPLFGPDTRLLAGRHVVVIDLGMPEANETVRSLFAPTMAEVITMDLASHDRIMAQVLGLSHALNIAFLAALAESGSTLEELARLSSTTFARQLAVATPVSRENPRLYFEIQYLNEFGGEVLDTLVSVATRIRDVVRAGDENGFVALMEAGRAFTRGA